MKKHEKTVRKTWNNVFNFRNFAGVFIVILLCAALYFARRTNRNDTKKVLVSFKEENNVNKHATSLCNLFEGGWIYDNVSYPLYEEKKCKFNEGFECERNGRKDLKYRNWRWQPHQCDLPRFNGKALLEKIRGKRLVYVGDSLNRNQWRSMLCLIQSSLSLSANKKVILKENLYIFHVTEYNASIEFYWSPFLVESNCDNMKSHRVNDRVIRINAIEKHARHWTDADILVFDSFIWWLDPSVTILWGEFGSSDAFYRTVDIPMERRYELTLSTWSDWLELNVNRTKTKMFFMSGSPFHCRGEISGVHQHCYHQSEPILKEGKWGCPSNYMDMTNVAELTIEKLKTRGIKVQYLDITQLSGYRKDAHPSIYKKIYGPLSDDQLRDPKSYSDCIHWCLPGVPDVWNQILYAYIMNPHKYQ